MGRLLFFGPGEWLGGLFGNCTHLPLKSLGGGGCFGNSVYETLDDVQDLLVLLFKVFDLVAKCLDVAVAWVW